MNLEVELRPHVGKQMVPGLGEVDVVFDQYMIYITGQDYQKATGNKELHAGFVHKDPVYKCPVTGNTFKPPINWLPVVNQWPQPVVDALSRSVQNALASMADARQGDKDLVAAGETRPVDGPLPPLDTSSIVVPPADADDENL